MDKKCNYCDEVLLEWDYNTNCGHSLCASCYRLDTSKCLLCKKHCEYRLIGEQMCTNGTKFLTPIPRVLNDAQDIIEFQMSSLYRMVSFLRDKVERQRVLLQQVKQELTSVKDFKWELHHLREENELLKNKLNKQQKRQQQKLNNDKMQHNKHEEKKEQEKETDKSANQEQEEEDVEERSYQEQDNESDMYYHPLRKEDFSSQGPLGKEDLLNQEMSVHRRTGPFSFQSRANQLDFQNLF